ncbi:hypothetical protein CC80DRAFT_554463 [Byssothecium circinans]|uniref:BTB domain-containing protein n=1 Tax=Byssothecium circinans TaxID=147558 RepID=A0A6A5TEZ6_9PLEO|nr:hypothetical protein CC80DRAFT_554463 [Byssothecium circinans]
MAKDAKEDKNNGSRVYIAKSKALPLKSSILKIVVGEEKTVFSIHEAVLTARSKFFKNAMTGNWKEAEDKAVKLPEDDPDVFALYEQIVYTGKIPAYDDTGDERRDIYCQGWDRFQKGYEILCSLFVLAERLQDMNAKNMATDAILNKYFHGHNLLKKNDTSGASACLPGKDAINIMCEGTPAPSPGRDVLVDLFVYLCDYQGFDGSQLAKPHDLHEGFLYPLLLKLMCLRRTPTTRHPHFRAPDYYHMEEGDKWPRI